VALALYRKYRPRTFDEVIGQEHVTAPLIQAIRNGKLNHAYLFSGPRGCGKTTSARILARSLNCANGPTPDPCGVCDSCVSLAPDGPGSLDVIEIDAASHGGVDDARELRERAFFAPVSSRFKVYIVDEAHMVSSAGFNALLKLVEEPPDYVVFVFATTEPEKVLQTIRSRTHHYPFRLVPPSVMRGRLEKLCAAEGARVEPAVFPVVVRASGGSMRDAESILDQLLSGAGPDGVSYARAVSLLGVTDSALLDEMCDALAAADGAAAFGVVDRVVEAGHDPRRYASDLLERLRDLVVLDRVPDAAAKGLIDAPADQLDAMTGHASRLGTATLSRMADIVHDGLVQMRGTTSSRLLLELVCARMLLPAADSGPGAVLHRLERLERRLEAGGMPPMTGDAPVRGAKPAVRAGAEPPTPARPTPTSTSTSTSTPTPTSTSTQTPTPPPVSAAMSRGPVRSERSAEHAALVVESPSEPPAAGPVATPTSGATLDAAAVRRVWDQIVEAVKHRRAVWSLLKFNATASAVDGSTLVLTFPTAPLARRLSDSANAAVVIAALRDVLGVDWTLRCEVTGNDADQVSPTGSVSAAAAASARAVDRQPVRAGDPTPPSRGADDWPAVRPVGGAAGSADLPPVPAVPSSVPSTGPSMGRSTGRQAAAPPVSQPAGSDVGAGDAPERGASRPERGASHPERGPLRSTPPQTTGRAYEGFDPGDEPVDDGGTGPDPRQDPEAEALELVQQTLGGRKISES
jgi:DNA polymerase-3 subunit gamma/tau